MLINGIPLLLQIFDRMVLPTHACSHVQFLLFRLTSLHEVRGRVVHVQLCRWMVVVYSRVCEYDLLPCLMFSVVPRDLPGFPMGKGVN